MSEHRPGASRPSDEPSSEARQADHDAIDRLADELLPSLVARLGASGLGELEVREGAWRVRLRRPPGADRRLPPGGRAAPGRAGSKAGSEDARGGRDPGASASAATAAGAGTVGSRGSGASASASDGADALPPLTAVGLGDDAPAADSGPAVATSPAVGIFRAKADSRSGTRVRSGDRLGDVDVLGVAVEVSAPVDGIVATTLVEDGDAVEYGQPLVALEPLKPGPPGHASGTAPPGGATPGGATPAAGGA